MRLRLHRPSWASSISTSLWLVGTASLDRHGSSTRSLRSKRRAYRLHFITGLLTLSMLVMWRSATCQTDLPDANQTPGFTNPAVTPENIQKTICVPGYTSKIRPPAYYTTTLKKQQLKQAKYADKTAADYEEDHLISLEIGGHPRDPKNLWPQSYSGAWNAHMKDTLENELHRRVCAGQLDLREAQSMISTDWITAYKNLVGEQKQ